MSTKASLTNTFPLLLAELVAFVAYARVPHWQVNAVSCSTDIRIHSTFIDFFKDKSKQSSVRKAQTYTKI